MNVDKLATRPLPIESSPKYVSLANRLLRHIAQRSLVPGDFLGTEAELVQKHGVSRVTVRQALLLLERGGYISREKARGTFIKKSVQRHNGLKTTRGTVVLACSNEQADHTDEDFAFSTVVKAVERNLTARGFTSQILGFGSDGAADRQRLRELSRRDDLDAICTVGSCLDTYRDELPEVPIVTSCTFFPLGATWVGPDSQAACRTLIDYLLLKGHRQIAMLCSSQLHPEAYRIFAEAFIESFESAKVPCPRHLMYYAYPGEELTKLAQQLLTGPVRPTAVFAENWRVCQSILTVAGEVGIEVPGDVSLVAFGRNVLEITYPLAITAYVPDHERIGQKAVELLTAVLDGEELSSTQVVVAGRLVERDSVLPLR